MNLHQYYTFIETSKHVVANDAMTRTVHVAAAAADVTGGGDADTPPPSDDGLMLLVLVGVRDGENGCCSLVPTISRQSGAPFKFCRGRPRVHCCSNVWRTSVPFCVPSVSWSRAAAPATSGVAIDVPLSVAVPPLFHVLLTLEPGAIMLTGLAVPEHDEPQLENDERLSLESLTEPTETTSG